jgi:hypothetical protein
MASPARTRAIIRLKLEANLLPRQQSGRLWAGPGAGEVCNACDERITKKQIVHEWEYEGAKVAMHLRCYELWNVLRRRYPSPGG